MEKMSLVQWLVLPLVLHVLMTFAIGAMSLRLRIAAVRSGETSLNAIALNSAAWPDVVKKFGNSFDNQFQVPLLAYAAVAVSLALGLGDAVSCVLMWLFIVARLLHAYEHTGRNDIRNRLKFYLVSYLAVMAFWLWLALRLFVIG
jgi:hypothetical protein